jgi:hypothetical protein
VFRTLILRIGAEGGTRTPTSYLTRPSNVRVYQFRHFGSEGCQSALGYFFLLGCADGVSTVDVGCATGAWVAAGNGDGVATGEDCGVCTGKPDCRTELVPVIAGSDRHKAISMNAAAAPIVILESKVCVPLGPNAVLDTELENSAPASDFPG